MNFLKENSTLRNIFLVLLFLHGVELTAVGLMLDGVLGFSIMLLGIVCILIVLYALFSIRVLLIMLFFVIGMILTVVGWKMTGKLEGLGLMLVGMVFLLTALFVYNAPYGK